MNTCSGVCSVATDVISVPAIHLILAGAPIPLGGSAEVGNKAWNLIRMAAAALPVPPAFVLSTGWSQRPAAQDDDAPLRDALAAGIGRLETTTGLRFGSRRCPLVVSVRSGAAVSMPGMLETVLDVGLNAEAVEGLIRLNRQSTSSLGQLSAADPGLRQGGALFADGTLR